MQKGIIIRLFQQFFCNFFRRNNEFIVVSLCAKLFCMYKEWTFICFKIIRLNQWTNPFLVLKSVFFWNVFICVFPFPVSNLVSGAVLATFADLSVATRNWRSEVVDHLVAALGLVNFLGAEHQRSHGMHLEKQNENDSEKVSRRSFTFSYV